LLKAFDSEPPKFDHQVEGLHASFQAWKRQDRPLLVNDVGVVNRQYARFTKNMPSVRAFYAVKCSPDDLLITTLRDNGAGFDCATGAELRQVLAKGVNPEDIIFANPIKNVPDLLYAREQGVKKMTFDNADEVMKIKQNFPEAELVLRLLPDDSGSLMRFGSKFGAPLDSARELFALCRRLGMKMIGVSFHIGSGCFDSSKYEQAISMCRSAFTLAEEVGLPPLRFLDLGGGFPGNPNPNESTRNVEGVTPSFEEFAGVIERSLAKYFPVGEFRDLEIIAEPGRYFATAWGTLFAGVQGKRAVKTDGNTQKFLYYINDGVYGSFNCIIFDHAHPNPIPYKEYFAKAVTKSQVVLNNQNNNKKVSFQTAEFSTTTVRPCLGTIFGPTCDSMDVVVQDHQLPELFLGDTLVFEHMGAYTTASGTEFNGCKRPLIRYIHSGRS
jgi:ornithine decarboxylase